MKKIINIVYFVFSTTICWCGQDRIANRMDQRVSIEKKLLQQKGITQESVASFITNMKKIVSAISDDTASDKLFLQKEIYKSEIDIVNCLLKYQGTPTEKDANFLRSWANTSTFWAEIIIPEMDKQSDPRYKFDPLSEVED